VKRRALAVAALMALLLGCVSQRFGLPSHPELDAAREREREARMGRASFSVASARASAAREQRYQVFQGTRMAASQDQRDAADCETEVDLAVERELRAERERAAQRETYFSCLAQRAGASGNYDAAACLLELANGAVRGAGGMCGADFAVSAPAAATCGTEPPPEASGPMLARSTVRETPACVAARAAGLR
jgi:hypothetical protein